MISKSDAPPSDDRAQRRWLIGIGITLLFGTFGAVMAVLAYTNSSNTPAPRGAARVSAPTPGSAVPAVAPAPAPTPDKPDEDRERKDHGRKGRR